MILHSERALSDNLTTLDDLFRRAGVQRPDAPALADPPNRADIVGGAPRILTYAEADRAISAIAARLRGLDLATDTLVAVQLPNTVESIIALLGVLRAGMIAVPLPLLWRKQEIVAALGRVGAKAIITCARIGRTAPAEIAMQAAAELFPIRAICAFGDDLPDGVVPLDTIWTPQRTDTGPATGRPGNPAAHVAAITFDVSAEGFVPVAHSHDALIADGREIAARSAVTDHLAILSTIPTGSRAGLVLTLLPWLLHGGTLRLHHAFDPAGFAAQARACDILVLPGPMLTPLADDGLLGAATSILALWRAGEPMAAAAPWHGRAHVVDIASTGETVFAVARRGDDGRPQSLSREDSRAGAGFIAVGGYRFRQSDADALVSRVDTQATLLALPHALLGQRFAGSAPDSAAMQAGLDAAGANALITGAFRPRIGPPGTPAQISDRR